MTSSDVTSAPASVLSPDAPLHRVLLLVEYDGTDFHGWQMQPDVRTVQQVLTEAVSGLVKHPVTLRASSRTDAGVHSWGLPVLVETTQEVPTAGWVLGLNSLLPRDVCVASARGVSSGFDPRRSSLSKTYRYQLWNCRRRSALFGRHSWHVASALDRDAMRRAADWLCGEHDFTSFRSVHCDSVSVHRYMKSIEFIEEPSGIIAIDITANAFLRNMARIVVGTLVDVGAGRMPAESIPEVLDARDRARAGQTGPAHGLFLKEVQYP